MSDHEHRPTYLNFVNTKRVCRCKHCDQPIKCTNRWLFYLSLLPAQPVIPAMMNGGLQHWPVFQACWELCALAQGVIFRLLRFEVDVVGQKDDGRNRLDRR